MDTIIPTALFPGNWVLRVTASYPDTTLEHITGRFNFNTLYITLYNGSQTASCQLQFPIPGQGFKMGFQNLTDGSSVQKIGTTALNATLIRLGSVSISKGSGNKFDIVCCGSRLDVWQGAAHLGGVTNPVIETSDGVLTSVYDNNNGSSSVIVSYLGCSYVQSSSVPPAIVPKAKISTAVWITCLVLGAVAIAGTAGVTIWIKKRKHKH